RIAAAAEQVRAAVEAEAQRLLNEAENVLSDASRASLYRRRLLERIEGILQVDGLAGGGGNGGRSPSDEVIESALRYRVQAPLIDQVLSEIGIEGGSLTRMGGLIREARDMQGIRKESSAKKPPEGGGSGGSSGQS